MLNNPPPLKKQLFFPRCFQNLLISFGKHRTLNWSFSDFSGISIFLFLFSKPAKLLLKSFKIIPTTNSVDKNISIYSCGWWISVVGWFYVLQSRISFKAYFESLIQTLSFFIDLIPSAHCKKVTVVNGALCNEKSTPFYCLQYGFQIKYTRSMFYKKQL